MTTNTLLRALAQQVARGEAGALEVLADALIEHGVIDAGSPVAPLAAAREWALGLVRGDGVYLAGRIYARRFDVRVNQDRDIMRSISRGYVETTRGQITTTIHILGGDPSVRSEWERIYRNSAGARVLEVISGGRVTQFRGHVVEVRGYSSDESSEDLVFEAYNHGVHGVRVLTSDEDAAELFGEGSELARAVARAGRDRDG